MPQVYTDFSAVEKVLEQDIYTSDGLLLLTKGCIISHIDMESEYLDLRMDRSLCIEKMTS